MNERPPYEELVQRVKELEKKLSECRYAEALLEKDEEQYRTIVEAQTEFIVRCKPDGTRTFVNEAYLRHFGLTHEQAIGSSFLPQVAEEDRQSIHDKFARLTPENPTATDEHRVIRPDGSIGWQQWIDRAFFDAAGKKIELQSVGRDITDRKVAEDALAESKNRYKDLFSSIRDVIIMADQERIIIDANQPALRELFGYECEDIIGKSTRMLYADDAGYQGTGKEVFDKHKTEKGRLIEVEFRKKNGEVFQGELYAFKLLDNEEIPAANIGMIRDITSRKKAEDALQKSEEKYRSLISNIPDVAWTTDWHGSTIFISPNVESVYGYTAEEICGGGDALWFGRIHPDDLEDVKKAFHELFEMGLGLDVEYRIQRKDGQWIWLRDRSIGTYEKDGVKLADGIFSDVTAEKKAEKALRLTKYSVDHSADSAFWLDADARIIYVNEAACRSLEYSREELCSMMVHDFDPDFSEERWASHLQEMREHRSMTFESRHRSRGGRILPVEITINLQEFEGREYIFAFARDITERKRADAEKSTLEAQLRHAQKMEAVGQLAGGVAHDFNNFLTAIVGYANILLMKLPEDIALKSYVDNILAASERAANLTQSLLAFSRKQIMQPSPVELNTIVGDVGKLLRRIIGEDIELKIQAGTNDIVVMADRNQMEQALLNLATNARDAMPGGGTLAIETGRAEVDREFIALRGYGDPGTYAVLSVSDTGAGMDRETAEKIFEPFFTTKDVGKGTGLGLAMVYGIIRQHNGYITVSSEPGTGTTFTLYLPLAVRETDTVKPEKHLSSATGGSETILVAEDDENVRRLTTEVLTQFGYTVIVAEDGDDAVRKFAENEENIDILLLDVIMPKKNGRDVYEEACRVNPEIKALFLSGYTGDMLNSKKILGEGLHFVFKPVSPMDLLKKLREVLDA